MAIVVGIGGVSRAGKTFLAELIAQQSHLSAVRILPQDEFVKSVHEIPLIQDHIDWESPESIDFTKYKNAVAEASAYPGIAIAEGLLAFYDPGIVQLFDKIIFISLSYDEFIRRKQADLRWGKEPEWYIRHIWDSYLQYGQSPLQKTDTLHIRGELDFNIPEIMKFIAS
jgi:nicotinamide/nicotinate riboside kinase